MKRIVTTNTLIKPSAVALVCNFEKTTPDSLLYHNKVVTFFHDFGLVIHNIYTIDSFSRFVGYSSDSNFDRLIIQMLKSWAWNEKVLKKLSKHYQTG